MVKVKAMELRTSRDFSPSKSWIEKFRIKYRLNFVKETLEQPLPNHVANSESVNGTFGSDHALS